MHFSKGNETQGEPSQLPPKKNTEDWWYGYGNSWKLLSPKEQESSLLDHFTMNALQ